MTIPGSANTDSGLEAGQHHQVRPALRAAARLLRSRSVVVVVATLCAQGALVGTALPILASLVQWTLRAAGIDGISQYSVGAILTSPVALLVLAGVAVLATAFVLAEVTLFAVIAHICYAGEQVTFGAVLRRSGRTARQAWCWQGLLLVPYLAILLPISEVGISSHLTQHVAIPRFIGAELSKTATGTYLYGAALAVIAYAMLRFVLFPALLAGSDVSVAQALGRSLRMTTWRVQVRFTLVLLGTVLAASLVVVGLGLVGLVPVSVAQSHEATGVTLAVLGLARFLVTGATAAFLAFFFVAFVRLSEGRSLDVRPPPRRSAERPGSATRIGVAVVVGVAVLWSVPRVLAGIDATVISAKASPKVIGHRGYAGEAVENSLDGLRAAAAAGADLVEMDIQETADGGFVVIHDVNLGRLAGVDRNIYELTEARATALTVRQDGMTAPIPTLEEFVAQADALGIRLVVDVKPHGHEAPGLARRIADEMDRLDPDHTHLVQSLDRGLVEDIARLDDERPCAFVVGFRIGDLPATTTGAVVIEDWSYRDSMLVEAHQQGRDLYVWTVNDVDLINDYLLRGVDGIITDEVAMAVDARHRLVDVADPVRVYLERARGLVAVG